MNSADRAGDREKRANSAPPRSAPAATALAASALPWLARASTALARRALTRLRAALALCLGGTGGLRQRAATGAAAARQRALAPRSPRVRSSGRVAHVDRVLAYARCCGAGAAGSAA